jgi:transposase-like protein
MSVKRKQHSADFKAKIALEAIKGRKTLNLNEIASENQIHPNLITNWKKLLQEQAASLFTQASRFQDEQKEAEALQEKLYQKIGQLEIELDFLKKKLGSLG